MEKEAFKIYVERLRDGAVEEISEQLSPDFLQQCDEDLSFTSEVFVQGQAYIAEKELVLHLDVNTKALIPCALCNGPVAVPLELKGLYIIEPLEAVKKGIFSFKEPLRESILVETPRFVKCGGERCLKEGEYTKYLKKDSRTGEDSSDADDDGHQPFANIDFKD